ncbi:MAG: hypothetical protein ACHQUC_01290 [Chlamydiales bacterium]
MKIGIKKTVEVEAKIIEVHAKVCDSASYTLRDQDGNEISFKEDYVPGFFPEEHYGDYLHFKIDIESGVIINWKKPTMEQIQEFLGDCE